MEINNLKILLTFWS